MIRYTIYAIFACLSFFSCQNEVKEEPGSSKEIVVNQPKPIMSAEESAAKLEALAERKALEFDIIYIDPTERLYMSRNRISHFQFKNGKPSKTIMKGVLADFDRVEAYKDVVRKSGFIDYTVTKKAEKPVGPFFQLTIDGKTREAVIAEIPDSNTKKMVNDLIKEFKALAEITKSEAQ